MSQEYAPGKYGKLFGEPLAVKWFDDYLTGPMLKSPPGPFSYGTGLQFPMACNDRLGCCTIAGVVHALQLAYAVVGRTFEYPGDQAVQDQYFELTGGADSGLVETDVLEHGRVNGMFGVKWTWAPIHVGNATMLEVAAFNFGAVYLGLAVPQSMQEQFRNGGEITRVPGFDPIVGGHCITASGDERAGFGGVEIETWGARTYMTPRFWQQYGTNAYVILPDVFEQVGHGPLASVDVAQLNADLDALRRANG